MSGAPVDDLAANRHTRVQLLDGIPDGLLECPANRLDTLLDGPSLIRVPGARQPPLFVSVLLHGNEVTGLLAMQSLLRAWRGRQLPRELLWFIGNIDAARHGARRLAGQPDYNRIWAGGEAPECDMARHLLACLEQQPLFAAVDVHNNSGRNPMYACVNRYEPAYINLAIEFSKLLVYFTKPNEVLSVALSRLCPATVIECGLSGEPEGTARVRDYLEHCLNMPCCEEDAPAAKGVTVYHTVGRITLAEDVRIGFGEHGTDHDLCLREDLEGLNFRQLAPGTILGHYTSGSPVLKVTDNAGCDATEHFIAHENQRVVLRKPCLLSMLTRDIHVIHQDCLGYVMQPYSGTADKPVESDADPRETSD